MNPVKKNLGQLNVQQSELCVEEVITNEIEEIRKKLRPCKTEQDAVIISGEDGVDISQLIVNELQNCGFNANVECGAAKYIEKENTASASSAILKTRFIITLDTYHEEFGQSAVTLTDTLDQSQQCVELDHAIHIMTQILL